MILFTIRLFGPERVFLVNDEETYRHLGTRVSLREPARERKQDEFFDTDIRSAE